ncbi:MAG: ribbon-helix-helix domain-containing protein [Bacteroidetes bacterium]|nr:ribbon-helix-helix domain-containing protein [Bacteroidota bacterium]MCL6097470.1 ribbon-helix-helix domain-containing protein [Bacteroidota bacterium]
MIEINLPSKLNEELELVTAEEGLSKSELVKKAIEDYLFIRKFRTIRKKMIPKAKGRGFKSDEDIFETVS